MRYSVILAMKNFVLLAFCKLTTTLDAIDKKYICSIWLWYSQWFNFAFVYEEIWICNYAQLHDRCNMVPIWSQPKEGNQALMISSCLVLFEFTVSIQTFTDTSPGSLVMNMPIYNSCMIQCPGIYFFGIRFQRWL